MVTKKRLISLNEALEATHKEVWWTESEQAAIRSLLVKLPRVDAVEVVHGRWEDVYDGKYDNHRFRCSVCKGKSLFKDKRDVLGNWVQVQALTDYCPNCGANMMGGDGNG